jgi:hypothetical protein
MLLGIPFSHIPFELHVTYRCAGQQGLQSVEQGMGLGVLICAFFLFNLSLESFNLVLVS